MQGEYSNFRLEAEAHNASRIADNDGVRGHIFGDDCSSAHHCAVADGHARHYHGLLTNMRKCVASNNII